ncbi:unknown [Crocosphaera subtropica ATCC 51142]|uniref:Helix-turn-helix domain-containing protein n=2 Tax=Crocosphaera TaxID=263510 RepID=B1WTB5_CROS5|nr:unknown [Crocosphaera subtropica ATCC 51142]
MLRLFRLPVMLKSLRFKHEAIPMTVSKTLNKPFIPSESEIKTAQESSRILASHLQSNHQSQTIKLLKNDSTEQVVEIPASAFHLLIDILTQMAQGNAITLIPIHAELTTQEAADILNVSRPYVIKLLESGEIPFTKVGKHRRIRFEDIMNYKDNIDRKRSEVLDKLVEQAQELNMGYE